jgi:heme A synthase
MGQIAVDLFHLAAAVYIVLVLLRLIAQLTARRAPSISHALEFAIGK